MSSPEAPDGPEPRAVRTRRLIWAGGTVVALWFIADGLRGMWAGAGTVAQVLIIVAAVLVVGFVVVGVVYLARRGREG